MTIKHNNWKSGPTFISTFIICILLVLLSGLYVFARGAVSLVNSNGIPYMSGIGTAVAIYMNDNKGDAPAKDKWCDLLIQNVDMTPVCFITYDSDYVQGESTLAFNKVDIDDSSPSSLVMVFEAEVDIEGKTRGDPIEKRAFMQTDDDDSFSDLKDIKVYKDLWNISGGPEKLAIKPGCKYVPILFCDGYASGIKLEKLASLRWDHQNTDYSDIIQAKIDKANLVLAKGYKKVWIIIAVLAVLTLLSLRKLPVPRKKLKILIIFSICVSLLGWFFGSISYATHMSFHDSNIGSILGLSSGLFLAIWYFTFIANIPAKAKNGPALLLWTILPGAICGGISSGLIHGTIITITNESFQQGVLPGLLFGISVGAMIGIVTTFFINQEKSDHGPISEPV